MPIISDEIYWKNLPPNTLNYEDLYKVIFPIYQTLEHYKQNLRKKSLTLEARKTNKSIAELKIDHPEELLTPELKRKIKDDLLLQKSIMVKGKKYSITQQPNKANQFILQPNLTEAFRYATKSEDQEILVKLQPFDGIYIELDVTSEEEEQSLKFLAKGRAIFKVVLPTPQAQGQKSTKPSYKYLKVIHFYSSEKAALIQSMDLPTQFEIHIEPNLSVIEKKKKALLTILERPKVYLFPLLRLFEKYNPRRIAESSNFPRTTNIQAGDWKYLNRDEFPGVEEQRDFVIKALNTPDFGILEGPPGSGKTTTILEILHQATLRDQRIILVGSTNVAVDNVLERIHNERLKKYEQHIFPVRISHDGDVSEIAEEYLYENIVESESQRILNELKTRSHLSESQKELLQNLESNPACLADFIISTANVICGTTIGILGYEGFNFSEYSIYEPFDMMIIDEASKTTFQEFLVPALLAKKWIIIGDKMQLSPFIEMGEVKALENRCFLDEEFEEEHHWLCSEYLSASKGNIIITDVASLEKTLTQNLQREEFEGLTYLEHPLKNLGENAEGNLQQRLLKLFGSSGGFIDYRLFGQDFGEQVLNAIPADLDILVSPRVQSLLNKKEWEILDIFMAIHNRRRSFFKMRDSEEIKSWIEEISWRLKRMYELRHQTLESDCNTELISFERDLDALLPNWPLRCFSQTDPWDTDQRELVKKALRVKAFALIPNLEIERQIDAEIDVILQQSNTMDEFFDSLNAKYTDKIPQVLDPLMKQLVFFVLSRGKSQEEWIRGFYAKFPSFFDDLLKYYIGNEVFDVLRIEFPSIIELLQSGLMVEPKYRNSEIYRCTIYQGYQAKLDFWKSREVKLTYQHRMHPDISRFIREHFYNGKQVLDPDGTRGFYDIRDKRSFGYITGSRNVWSVVRGEEVFRGSYVNFEEIDQIFTLFTDFEAWAQTHPKQKEFPEDDTVWKIAVLTFYAAQEAELSKKFAAYFPDQTTRFHFTSKNISIRICNVDKFQGQEADVVLLSFVRTQKVGFLDSLNRLNVSLSRAKYFQVLVGDRKFFERNYVKRRSPILHALAEEVKPNYNWKVQD